MRWRRCAGGDALLRCAAMLLPASALYAARRYRVYIQARHMADAARGTAARNCRENVYAFCPPAPENAAMLSKACLFNIADCCFSFIYQLINIWYIADIFDNTFSFIFCLLFSLFAWHSFLMMLIDIIYYYCWFSTSLLFSFMLSLPFTLFHAYYACFHAMMLWLSLLIFHIDIVLLFHWCWAITHTCFYYYGFSLIISYWCCLSYIFDYIFSFWYYISWFHISFFIFSWYWSLKAFDTWPLPLYFLIIDFHLYFCQMLSYCWYFFSCFSQRLSSLYID